MSIFESLVKQLPPEGSLTIQPRSYINHSVQFKKQPSPTDRMRALENVGLNVFYFPGEMITGCDMLSDSGTTTMTAQQWAMLHLGDESYGSNSGYFLLMEQVSQLFGADFIQEQNFKTPTVFLFHQ